MNKNGPIVIIEDDLDDQQLPAEAFEELGYPNEIKFFTDGKDALNYLEQQGINPFLILSDVNMPRLDGFELRKIIHTDERLSQKCIRFLFFSTHASPKVVMSAYAISAQGFFVKPSSYEKLVTVLRKIVEYWQECMSPANYIRGGQYTAMKSE